MELADSINFIKTGKETFIMEKNLRYIDLENINKYTKKQIFSILTSVGIFTNPSYKKSILIGFLMRNEKALNKIKADNRAIKLAELLSK
jgi:hypothetical protein